MIKYFKYEVLVFFVKNQRYIITKTKRLVKKGAIVAKYKISFLALVLRYKQTKKERIRMETLAKKK